MKRGTLPFYEGFITVCNFMKIFWVSFFTERSDESIRVKSTFFLSQCDMCKYGFLFYL